MAFQTKEQIWLSPGNRLQTRPSCCLTQKQGHLQQSHPSAFWELGVLPQQANHAGITVIIVMAVL